MQHFSETGILRNPLVDTPIFSSNKQTGVNRRLWLNPWLSAIFIHLRYYYA